MQDKSDNLIEPFRAAGAAYVDSFKGDLQAVCADLRRLAQEEHRDIVSLPPKPPEPWYLKGAGKEKKGHH